MTSGHAAWILVCLAAMLAAVALSHRHERHRPMLWYLGGVLLLDMAQLALRQLPPSGTLWCLDQTLWLGLKLAPAALAVAVFLRRRPWLLLVPWAILASVVAGSYPNLYGDKLLVMYSAAELGTTLVVGGVAIMLWACGDRFLAELGTVRVWSCLVLWATSLVSSAMPSLVGPHTLERWDAVRGLWIFALGAVLVLQLQSLWRDDSRECSLRMKRSRRNRKIS